MGTTWLLGALGILSWITMVRGNCPIAECTCLNGETERTIDCRDKNLHVFPTITASNEIFKEITFNSADHGCRENKPPTCSNTITHIPSRAFQGLRVRKIDFGRSILTTVDDNAFEGLESLLTELILEGNGTSRVPLTSLTNLTNLVSLTLESFTLPSNGLQSFPQEFTKLATLILHSLQLEYIAEGSVTGKLRNLKRIEIIDNPKLTAYPVGVFRQLTTLEHIRFVQNGIDTLQAVGNAFENHVNLKELDLSHNMIYSLQTGCFQSLDTRLTFLSLALNYLDAGSLQELKSGNWQHLQQLILDSNSFYSGLPANLFQNMPNLANLNLQQTQLTTIEQNTFSGLQGLHSLHLSGNDNLNIHKGAFNMTPNLKELFIDIDTANNINFNFSMDTAIGLTNLERLELSRRYLEAALFWKSLPHMPNLKHLKLSATGLSSIPDLAFQYNTKLESIELDTNGLTKLTQAQIHGPGKALKSLHLATNFITLIDKCVVQELEVLEVIFLNNNPLTCDCRMIDFYNWAKRKATSIPEFAYALQAKCSNKNNSNLLDLQLNELVCDNPVSPLTCQTFTTSTTTTTTPSTTPIPTPPLPIITLSIVSRDQYNLQISWTATGTINKFFLTQQELGSSNLIANITIDHMIRQWTLLSKVHLDYKICIKATTDDNRSTVPVCKDSLGDIHISTVRPTESPQTGFTSGEIIGISVGGLVLLILFFGILFFLIRYQTRPTKYKDTPPVQFTAVPRPTFGYDSKRFSKPKKSPQANGDLIVSAISSGKTVPSSPDSRHSAGSYQYLNENQMLDIQPHLKYANGANGGSNPHSGPGKAHNVQGYLKTLDGNPSSPKDTGGDSKGKNSPGNTKNFRYDKTPGQLNGLVHNKPHSYANDPHNTTQGVYTNDIQDRPLPKPRTKHYENNSAGFLNHGFDLDSPTDHTYNEIPETCI